VNKVSKRNKVIGFETLRHFVKVIKVTRSWANSWLEQNRRKMSWLNKEVWRQKNKSFQIPKTNGTRVKLQEGSLKGDVKTTIKFVGGN